MTVYNSFSHPQIILDACCAINLYQSGKMGEILRSLHASITITTHVYEEEVLGIQDTFEEGVIQMDEKIDLQPFIDCGLLALTSLESEVEEIAFVNFAATLDDGEAITGAIALARNWAIATDDRKAINFLMRTVPAVPIVSTLELLQHWVETTCPSREIVQTALRNIRTRARYEPGQNHPLYIWWQACIGE